MQLPTIYHGPRHHIVDITGQVLSTDLPPGDPPHGADIINHNIDEILYYKDVPHFMACLKSASSGQAEICAYRVRSFWFVARMERISSMRVRVSDVNVTDIEDMAGIIKLFERTKTP